MHRFPPWLQFFFLLHSGYHRRSISKSNWLKLPLLPKNYSQTSNSLTSWKTDLSSLHLIIHLPTKTATKCGGLFLCKPIMRFSSYNRDYAAAIQALWINEFTIGRSGSFSGPFFERTSSGLKRAFLDWRDDCDFAGSYRVGFRFVAPAAGANLAAVFAAGLCSLSGTCKRPFSPFSSFSSSIFSNWIVRQN